MCDSHDHAIHEVIGAEEALAEMRARVEALEAALHAERTVGEAVAEGKTTIAEIAAALRARGSALLEPRTPEPAGRCGIFEHPADVDRRMWLGTQLITLADEIEKGS